MAEESWWVQGPDLPFETDGIALFVGAELYEQLEASDDPDCRRLREAIDGLVEALESASASSGLEGIIVKPDYPLCAAVRRRPEKP
jgi:hypothetical protein